MTILKDAIWRRPNTAAFYMACGFREGWMRIATFNVESLDARPKSALSLAERAEILRPQLERLDADVLCLQEVNSQKAPGRNERHLDALSQLICGTRYEHFHVSSSRGPGDAALADVHNLVILSRFPVLSQFELKHTFVTPPLYRLVTVEPEADEPRPVIFDRPALIAELALPEDKRLTVVNVHLRAPLASAIAGQKLGPFLWKSSQGWAEGFFLSSLKRTAQALEIRLAVDNMFDTNLHHLTAICGDFNAEDHETPLRILQAAEDDTGNSHLAIRSLIVADRSLPADRRYSVLHNGRPQMLDHILITRSLASYLKDVQAHNEAMSDEAAFAAAGMDLPGSFHAPIVAEFALH